MILSFRNRRTRDFARGHRVRAFEAITRQAQMKLDRLDAANPSTTWQHFPVTGSRH